MRIKLLSQRIVNHQVSFQLKKQKSPYLKSFHCPEKSQLLFSAETTKTKRIFYLTTPFEAVILEPCHSRDHVLKTWWWSSQRSQREDIPKSDLAVLLCPGQLSHHLQPYPITFLITPLPGKLSVILRAK